MDKPHDERASPGPQADLSFGERLYLREAIKGMGVLAHHFFKNLFGFRDPAPEILDRKGPGVNMVTTIQYPDERKPLPPGYRGMHRLVPRVDGTPRCVACYMCATACPAQCIYIEAAENTDQLRISGGERYAKVYNIDYNRCIFCAYCVEACPTDAITHGHGFEIASYNTSTLIYRKEQMLVPIPQGAHFPLKAEPESTSSSH